MKITKKLLFLYAVTDRRLLKNTTFLDAVEKTLSSGTTMLQIREKDLSFDEFLDEAKQVKKLTDKYNIPLIINDNIEIALLSNADGVHVGQEDIRADKARKMIGDDKILGVSASTVEEAIIAEKMGADYIGVGSIFSTSTKLDAKNVSLETLKNITNAVKIPIVAIGGINKNNVLQLSNTGINGVAVISAIFAEEDIVEATKNLSNLLKKVILL